ncbi:MAG: hypothetical protein RR712_01825 [Terrisporobacter sp.]|uniref:hypothetical protein n=1 Tax=Terrisporobacter sp. TaxID=1965305 RepID=UPI002FC7231A
MSKSKINNSSISSKNKKRQKTYKRNNSNNQSSSDSDNKTSKLCCFGYIDYIVLSSTLAIALGEELSSNDLNILASFFAVLSDELALISSVQNCESGNDSDVFVPPIPDVALTSTNNKQKKRIKKKK